MSAAAAATATRYLVMAMRTPAFDPVQGAGLLARVLRFLGQPVPGEVERLPLAEFWRWAVECWDISRVPAVRAVFSGDA